jgi:hypothetical protein
MRNYYYFITVILIAGSISYAFVFFRINIIKDFYVYTPIDCDENHKSCYPPDCDSIEDCITHEPYYFLEVPAEKMQVCQSQINIMSCVKDICTRDSCKQIFCDEKKENCH